MSSHVDGHMTKAFEMRVRSHGISDVLRLAASKVPGKLALVYRHCRYSYAELDAAVNTMANALCARGVRRGDRIALLSHNNDGYVIAYFSLARLGAISVPVNFMLNASEIAYILRHCGASGVVAEDRLVETAEAAIAQSGAPVVLRGAILDHYSQVPPGWDSIAEWLAHPDATMPDVHVSDDDPIQIMYTSGTESRPKGATLSSRSYMAQYISCIVNGEMSGDDVGVHCLPLYHCAQLHCFLTPGIYLGSTNIILGAPDPQAILAAVEEQRATSLFCPPTVWIALLGQLRLQQRDLSSLKKGYYGASIMPTEIVKELLHALPGLRLFNFYGQTEMAPLATVLSPQDQLRKLGSAGRPAINVQTRIVDDADQPVPSGTIGEIVHRSPHLMLGYWNDPETTAAAFRGDWFHSGDLGVMDEEGYLRVVDRKKDMIKSGGENVASREVEEVLYSNPAVSEAAVFGLPDPLWIEAVTAAVVLREGARIDESALMDFCRERLAGFKTPKRIAFVERLPKNASGKILKRELRLQFVSEASWRVIA